MQQQCLGINKAGERCKGRVMTGSGYCIAHDPNRVTDLAEYRKKGGHARSNASRARKAITGDLRDLGTVQAAMLKALKGLEDGTVEPPVATAMATVARSLVAVAQANAAVNFEQQLADMARQIAELSERQPA